MALQDRLLTLTQVADYLGVAPKTIVNWRLRDYGPPGYRLAGTTRGPLRFRRSAVDRWLEERAEARRGVRP